MAQKERTKEIRTVLGYFIKTNYPIQNALLIFEDEDNISDQRQRIFDNLMSDESLLIDEINLSSKEVKSQMCPNSPRRKRKLNQSMDLGDLEKPSKTNSRHAKSETAQTQNPQTHVDFQKKVNCQSTSRSSFGEELTSRLEKAKIREPRKIALVSCA